MGTEDKTNRRLAKVLANRRTRWQKHYATPNAARKVQAAFAISREAHELVEKYGNLGMVKKYLSPLVNGDRTLTLSLYRLSETFEQQHIDLVKVRLRSSQDADHRGCSLTHLFRLTHASNAPDFLDRSMANGWSVAQLGREIEKSEKVPQRTRPTVLAGQIARTSEQLLGQVDNLISEQFLESIETIKPTSLENFREQIQAALTHLETLGTKLAKARASLKKAERATKSLAKSNENS